MNKGKTLFALGIFMMIFSGIVSVYATTCLYNSVDVSYDNTNSGLTSTNVQDSLDELYDQCTDYSELRSMIYPVGSIYLTVIDSTVEQVEERFGGTWERFAEGKTLISANSSYPINTSGGSVSESYTPAGNNSGMAVTMNDVTLTHSGGAVQNTTLTESQIPVIDTGTLGIHGQESGTIVYGINGKWYGSKISNQYKTLSATSGAYSYGSIGIKFGGGGAHNHGFTQPSAHSFTPSANSYTNPTFTGTEATISHMQPYTTVYMYKRVS